MKQNKIDKKTEETNTKAHNQRRQNPKSTLNDKKIINLSNQGWNMK